MADTFLLAGIYPADSALVDSIFVLGSFYSPSQMLTDLEPSVPFRFDYF